MTHTHIESELKKVCEVSVNEMARGCAFSAVQHWIGSVLVIHTMVSFTKGYWAVGIPTPGEAMFVTDRFEDALSHVAWLLDSAVVIVDDYSPLGELEPA